MAYGASVNNGYGEAVFTVQPFNPFFCIRIRGIPTSAGTQDITFPAGSGTVRPVFGQFKRDADYTIDFGNPRASTRPYVISNVQVISSTVLRLTYTRNYGSDSFTLTPSYDLGTSITLFRERS